MTTVRRVLPTATATEPAAALLRGYVDAHNEISLHTWGDDDYVRTPQEVHGATRDDAYEKVVRLVALDDDAPDEPEPDAVHGLGIVVLPMQDNTAWAYVGAEVRPGRRGRGVGTALYDAALEIARAHGRTTLMAETDHAAEPAPGAASLTAPTGSGRVPADDAGARFLTARGWQLEQVARRSIVRLPLDADEVERARAESAAVAGPEYRTVGWEGPVPPRWRAGMAALFTVMSDGVPLAGLEYEQERWDDERVRLRDDEHARRGIVDWTTAVEHVPSGTLVGYTVLQAIPPAVHYVHQEDTLVVPGHRGRRLGMLLKATNLQRLAAARPQTRRVGTWNAEENDHMLAINIALGFRPAGCSGEWQLRLGDAAPGGAARP